MLIPTFTNKASSIHQGKLSLERKTGIYSQATMTDFGTNAATNSLIGDEEENMSTLERFTSKFGDGVCGVLYA
jgi:hypothetical protein